MTYHDVEYVPDWYLESHRSAMHPRFSVRIHSSGHSPVSFSGTVLVDERIEIVETTTPLEREYQADHLAVVVQARDTGAAICGELWSDRGDGFCRIASFGGARGGYLLTDRPFSPPP